MSERGAGADEKRKANFNAVCANVDASELWALRDVDPMADGAAYVFYLRTKKKIRYRNYLGEQAYDKFEHSVMVPGQLIEEHPERCGQYVREQAVEALQAAKHSA